MDTVKTQIPSARPVDIEWSLYESRDPETAERMLGVCCTATMSDGSVIRNAARLRVEGLVVALEIGKRQLRMWLEDRTECEPLPDGIERVRVV